MGWMGRWILELVLRFEVFVLVVVVVVVGLLLGWVVRGCRSILRGRLCCGVW